MFDGVTLSSLRQSDKNNTEHASSNTILTITDYVTKGTVTTPAGWYQINNFIFKIGDLPLRGHYARDFAPNFLVAVIARSNPMGGYIFEEAL